MLLAALATLGALSACGTMRAPPNAAVYGLGYLAVTVPAGSLLPFVGQAWDDRVEIDEHWVVTFVVAHEVAHVWQRRGGVIPAGFMDGMECPVQSLARCTRAEAHADAAGLAGVQAGCLPGDYGWPGEEKSGCALPDLTRLEPWKP